MSSILSTSYVKYLQKSVHGSEGTVTCGFPLLRSNILCIHVTRVLRYSRTKALDSTVSATSGIKGL